MRKEVILEAIRFCRQGECEKCPIQDQICDELYMEMEDVPAELLDLIEEELES